MSEQWKQQRRAQVGREDQLPQHFCDRCSALRVSGDTTCPECDLQRPQEGWSDLGEAYDPFLGRVLNERYLISKIEGRGSSSTIYRADSLSVPKRFAVKMVKLWHSEEGVTEQVRTRLEREVRAVGMLRNPHIVRVYELLELDQNWIALVMDHIDGQTLAEAVEHDGPMELERACTVIRQVANGLCEAHEVGMIHRDLKPENIMIERLPDGHDFAFVLDFGVVRLEGEAGMTQGFLGTPLYASPEQAMAGRLDRRSDIYSLGATLFYLLTGRPPFDSERSLEVLKAHVGKKPPTLAEASGGRSFPRAIERLVARMLAKAPDDRPKNLIEVIDALESYEQDTEDTPRAVSVVESADLARTVSLDELTDEPDPRQTSAGLGANGHKRTMSFQDRPQTVLGFRQALDDEPDTEEFAAPRVRADGADGEPQGFTEARYETNPRGFQSAPQTNPVGERAEERKVEVKRTLQFVDLHGAARGGQGATVEAAAVEADIEASSHGIAFARAVRKASSWGDDFIAFVDAQNEVWMIEQSRLEPLCSPLSRVTCLAVSEAGAFIGQSDGTVSRLVTEAQDFQAIFQEDDAAISALAATRAGMTLLAATDLGDLYLGQLQKRKNRWRKLTSPGPVQAVRLTATGGMFAVAIADGEIRVASTDSPGSPVATLVVAEPIVDMAFSNDGHLLAVLLEDGRVAVFQVYYGRQISELCPECPAVSSLYFSRDNILCGVSTGDQRVTRWNLTTGEPLAGE